MSFKQNCEISLVQNPHAAENVFIEKEPENHPLPTFEQERDRLPHPIWDGHGDEIACYWKHGSWRSEIWDGLSPAPDLYPILLTPHLMAVFLCGILPLY